MGWFGRREGGFTLLELMGVLAILAVVVAVVVLALVGFKGRGGEESYNTDKDTLQTAVSAFYADKHSYDPSGGWNEASGFAPDSNFPTRNGSFSDLYPGDVVNVGGQKVYLLMKSSDDSLADAGDVINAAIWMGLLVNAPGSGINPDSKDNSSPLAGELGPYLNEVPKSCSTYNSYMGKGTYTWIVGKDGKVYGVFVKECVWHVGYSGAYP